MLFQRCNAIFNKETVKELEKTNPYQLKSVGRQDQHKELFFNKRVVPQKT